MHSNGKESNPLNYTFHIFFAAHSVVYAVSCHRSNTGLQLVLVEQIRNAQL